MHDPISSARVHTPEAVSARPLASLAINSFRRNAEPSLAARCVNQRTTIPPASTTFAGQRRFVPQVVGAAQGDCAARQPGRLPLQHGNGAICRSLPEPLQSRCCVFRSGGDHRTCSRHVRARNRRCRTRTRAEWERPSRGDHIRPPRS